MPADILQYSQVAFEAFRQKMRKYHVPPKIDAATGIRSISGDFSEGADLFFSLHPNKSVIERCVAPLHTHDYIELVYVRRGELHQNIANKPMKMGAGELLLLNSGTAHEPWVEGRDDVVVNLGVRLPRLEQILGGVTGKSGNELSDFIDALFDRRTGKRRAALRIRQNRTVDDLINEMFCEYFRGDAFAEKVLLTDLVRLMIELCRHDDKAEKALPEPDDMEALSRLLQRYIDENYATATMETLSAHFGYSERHMRRLLRRVYDESLPELLNRIRIEKACEYIDRCDMPTEEIMLRVGFTDTGYFYRVFQRIAGMRLADYRHLARPQPKPM